MADKHLSTQFDAELSGLSTRVLEMGGLVESQVANGVRALASFSGDLAADVLRVEERVNAMEVEIDRDLSSIIARRQPTARDLRLLIAVSKTIANLERIGDEAARIARTAQRLLNAGMTSHMRLPISDLSYEAELATRQLRQALDAFARLDTAAALDVLKSDNQIDLEFEGLLRKLITYMMEDPRTISTALEIVWIAKAIERIGDHAKNMAEYVIYIVKGTDVRHTKVAAP
jgi:phosphate transport system protein